MGEGWGEGGSTSGARDPTPSVFEQPVEALVARVHAGIRHGLQDLPGQLLDRVGPPGYRLRLVGCFDPAARGGAAGRALILLGGRGLAPDHLAHSGLPSTRGGRCLTARSATKPRSCTR